MCTLEKMNLGVLKVAKHECLARDVPERAACAPQAVNKATRTNPENGWIWGVFQTQSKNMPRQMLGQKSRNINRFQVLTTQYFRMRNRSTPT